jgi:hypothetical protein
MPDSIWLSFRLTSMAALDRLFDDQCRPNFRVPKNLGTRTGGTSPRGDPTK